MLRTLRWGASLDYVSGPVPSEPFPAEGPAEEDVTVEDGREECDMTGLDGKKGPCTKQRGRSLEAGKENK